MTINQKTKFYLNQFFIVLLILTFSCGKMEDQKNNHIESKGNMEEVKITLESGDSLSVQTPFVVREFDPYLNGEWIGNAVSYGCYRKGQAPGVVGPSKEEILEDLNILKEHWNLIRIYNADDDARRILEVIRTNDLPIKMMLGVWLAKETGSPETKILNIKNAMYAIELGNEYKDIIAAISVGNEAQVDWSYHKMNLNRQIQYVRAVRNNVPVPVTVADDYNFWNKPRSKNMAKELDFIVTHAYALWNGQTLDNAIEWTDRIFFEDVKKNHPNKFVALGETGWATTYNAEKTGPGEQGSLIKGKVGLKPQEEFLKIFNNWVNEKQVVSFLFEAFDEPWKGGGEASGPNEVEKHWGVFYENRTPKESFSNYLLTTKK